ncbi:unnamed protein product, partial [Discosporangium mesarthrocarpum]
VPLSTLYLTVKRDGVKAVRRWIKSVLCEKAKVTRVEFVLSHVSRKGGTGMVVDDMYDWVYVDEKWFYVMRDGARLYLRPDEDVPNPPGSPASASSARSCFSSLWVDPGSYQMGPGSMARSASGQSLRLSKQSAATSTVLLVAWKSTPSPWTGNSTSR